MNNYKVTISFNFQLSPIEDIEADDLSFHLQDQFDNWNDGRYPLHIEVVKKSIRECLDAAIYSAIEDRDAKRYSGEYYEINNGKTAKFLYTARRAYRRAKLWFDGNIKSEIEQHES